MPDREQADILRGYPRVTKEDIYACLLFAQQAIRIKRVWLLGGAELVASFKADDLIDESIITVIPKKLHEGIALPANLYDGMQEVESRQFSQGIIERRYIRK